MRTFGVIVVTLLAVCDGGGIARAGEPPEIQGLRSENPNERDAARRALAAQRAALIASLEGMIRELVATERKGTVRTAMQMLGDVRSVDSAPLLAEYMSFQYFYKDAKRPQSFEDTFPAAGALIEIGLRAVGPVLEQATMSPDEDVQKMAAVVVCQIHGRKWAAIVINERIEREANPAVTERLLRVRKHLESGNAEKKIL